MRFGKVSVGIYLAGRALSWVRYRERWALAGLTIGNVCAVIIEAGAAGLMYVYFSLALSPDKISDFVFIVKLQEFLGLIGNENIMIFMTFFVMIIFIVRTMLLGWLKWFDLTLKLRLQRRISINLFNFYVFSNLTDHQLRKRAEIVSNIWANSASAISHCTFGVVEIISSAVLIFCFGGVVALTEPEVTMVAVTVVFILFCLYWQIVSKKISVWGQMSVNLTNRMFSLLHESFSGFKAIKVFQLEESLSDRFKDTVQEQTSLVRLNSMIQEAPRLVLELIIIVSILGLVGSILMQGGDAIDVIPSLVLMGMAAVRIIPAVSRVVNALQTFKYSLPALEMTLRDYDKIPKEGVNRRVLNDEDSELSIDSIRLEGISFAYPEQSRMAIENISLEIKKGEFIGFIGQSGSGKTTAADILLGLISPSKGKIFVNGLERSNLADFINSVAFVPQEPLIFSHSVAENIALTSTGRPFELEKFTEGIKSSALKRVLDQMPKGRETLLGDGGVNLSGGEAQRLNLSRALYRDPQLLILDEPTSALDSITEKIITDTLQDLHGQKTVVMIAHRLHTLQKCDCLYLFKDGKINGSGTFEELLEINEYFQEMVKGVKLPDNMSIVSSG